MTKPYLIQCIIGLMGFALAGCAASGGEVVKNSANSANSDKYGHMSAIYLCGSDQLQTSHTDDETKIAYKGDKFEASRTVQILDNAFAGETFTSTYKGDKIIFRGKGFDASLTINNEVISCEKLSCIPLGENH